MSLQSDLDHCNIPGYMQQGIINYIEHKRAPGGFLTAVITNDLRNAVGRADSINVKLLENYVQFFYNYAPSECWGSKEKFDKWTASDEEESERFPPGNEDEVQFIRDGGV